MLVYDNWTVDKSVVVSVFVCARVCVCVCVFYKGRTLIQNRYHKATLYKGVTWHTSDVSFERRDTQTNTQKLIQTTEKLSWRHGM